MVDDVSVLLGVYPFGIELFVIHPLTPVVPTSWKRSTPVNSQRVLHTFAYHSTSTLLPKPERQSSTPKAVTSGLWEVINLLFCLLRQA
jgi:hypothetical protein